MEAITASLEQQGADAQQKEEIEEMITPAERTQLTKIKHITNKYAYEIHLKKIASEMPIAHSLGK